MSRLAIVAALSLLLAAGFIERLECLSFPNPYFAPGRRVIVTLLEWKWSDIADECEQFLGPKGYGGVEVSPVTENLIVPTRPWYERYQPISYRWITRSGNEREFRDMVRRCNDVHVRIYVQVLLNHMTRNAMPARGTGGSTADTALRYYPAVPYTTNDFKPHCIVTNRSDVNQIRNCFVIGHVLDQKNENVRRKIVGLLNDLIAAGVAGFRIVSATFMWPEDLKIIVSRTRMLATDHGFPINARPYFYQTIHEPEEKPFFKYDYSKVGAITEVLFAQAVNEAVLRKKPLKSLEELDAMKDLLPSENAIVCVDKDYRLGVADNSVFTRRFGILYMMAVAFMLAHPYGTPMLMSSYYLDSENQGPPADENENIISRILKDDGTCEGHWNCEHRQPPIYRMVEFCNIVSGTKIEYWWNNDENQIAFSRGDQGFIAINNGDEDFTEKIQTKLPRGIYCDVISGELSHGRCTGWMVYVDESGKADVDIEVEDENLVIAIHRNSMMRGY